MKTLLKNGNLVNVFTGRLEKTNVLLDGELIGGIGDYEDADADTVIDCQGQYICPGFIDGHIHIESTMLTPSEFCRAALPHGTVAVVSDPHEIANVCGTAGLDFMLSASENLPLSIFYLMPSCVPATAFDESGASLFAEDISPYYAHPRVLGLAEVMNFPGVIEKEPEVMAKIADAKARGKIIGGHAPLLSGKALDSYLAAGIVDEHEASSLSEATERIRKGQRIMIRQGSQAKNLDDLLPLFEEPWAHRCLLVTDDLNPSDLVTKGHIDHIIRRAAQKGKSPITGIRMASLWAAEHFGFRDRGAVAPGYRADVLILDSLEEVRVNRVFVGGKLAAENGKALPFPSPEVPRDLTEKVKRSFSMKSLSPEDFVIEARGEHLCRVIELIPHQLITNTAAIGIDFSNHNGIDTSRGILKLAVIERHKNTGHMGLGFIKGLGMKAGAIASSVSHDSHNLIVLGTNEADMALAGNHIRALGGGSVVVRDGKILAELPLPIAGLMSQESAQNLAVQSQRLLSALSGLGLSPEQEPFMTMAFSALPVIPHLKLTTLGLFDVDRQTLLPLIID